MSVMTLYPYLYHGMCWVFDDPQTGLKEEAFVLGASEMISRLLEAKGIPNAERGFALLFSDRPFDHDVKLNWIPAVQAAKAMATRKQPAGDRELVYGRCGRPEHGVLGFARRFTSISKLHRKDFS